MEVERLKAWLGFYKFLLSAALIGGLSTLASWTLKNRELERQEMEQFGKYINHALVENVGTRERFARYFWRVSRSSDAKGGWKAYLDDVLQEKREEQGKETMLAAKEDELKKLAASDKAKAEELKAVRQELREVRAKLEVRRDAVAPGGTLTGHGSGQGGAAGTLSVSGGSAN